MANVGEHWEAVYAAKSSSEVSWYQRSPSISIRLVTASISSNNDPVLDVGGGTSFLVDHLLAAGLGNVSILDVAENALDEVRDRLGNKTGAVTFIHEDVLRWTPEQKYSVWHDRAVFHFLTEQHDRNRYVDTMRRALHDGGTAIIGTFADDGPTHCSGLPVSRYSADDLDAALAPAFSPIEHTREEHVTPTGAVQPFTWGRFRCS